MELTDDNFDRLVLDSGEVWLVEFFAPWCGHCKSLEPEWAAAASAVKEQTKDKVHLGAVDATVHQGLASRYGVSRNTHQSDTISVASPLMSVCLHTTAEQSDCSTLYISNTLIYIEIQESRLLYSGHFYQQRSTTFAYRVWPRTEVFPVSLPVSAGPWIPHN